MSFESIPFKDLFLEPQRNGLTKPSKVRGSGLPMVNMGEIFAHRRIGDIEMELVPIAGTELRCLLHPGDLLFARQSLVYEGSGKCVLFTGQKQTVFESHLIRVRLDPSKCDSRYYFYLFNCEVGRTLMSEIISQGAGASGIKGSDLIELAVPVPPLEDQTKIADFFDAFEEQIEKLKNQNTVLESIAQALFKSWFVDFDPVHAKAAGREPVGLSPELVALFPDAFEESELGPIPVGWQVNSLSEVLARRSLNVRAENLTQEVKYVGLEHLPRKCLTFSGWASAEVVSSNKSAFLRDDLLFGKLRPYFHKVALAPFDGVCSTDILVFHPKEPCTRSFGYLHLFSDQLVDHASQTSEGSRMPRTNAADLLGYSIVTPSKQLLLEFESIAGPLLDQIRESFKVIECLGLLRDELLPRLISGKIQLEDVEESIAEVLLAAVEPENVVV